MRLLAAVVLTIDSAMRVTSNSATEQPQRMDTQFAIP